MQFSANLGFLWKTLPLADAIVTAANAGFDAVECHWPYSHDPDSVTAALESSNLEMLGLNTWPGDFERGERGLNALPDRVTEARDAIDQALEYAAHIGCRSIHAMAGITAEKDSYRTFVDNLCYAAERAANQKAQILVEPINTFDMPGYFLHSTATAMQVMADVGLPNVRMMFDCYHVERMEGQTVRLLDSLLDHVGHVQIASVPGRNEPDLGDLDYGALLGVLKSRGYARPIGAEYVPVSTEESGLGWLQTYRDI